MSFLSSRKFCTHKLQRVHRLNRSTEGCYCLLLLESGVGSIYLWHERATYRKFRKELTYSKNTRLQLSVCGGRTLA